MSQTHTFEEIGKGRPAYLTGVFPAYEYVDKKKTDKQIGYRYYILIPARNYMKTSVLVKDMNPLCTNEEIKASLEVADMPVEFENFQARWYGDFKLTCTADSIREIKSNS